MDENSRTERRLKSVSHSKSVLTIGKTLTLNLRFYFLLQLKYTNKREMRDYFFVQALKFWAWLTEIKNQIFQFIYYATVVNLSIVFFCPVLFYCDEIVISKCLKSVQLCKNPILISSCVEVREAEVTKQSATFTATKVKKESTPAPAKATTARTQTRSEKKEKEPKEKKEKSAETLAHEQMIDEKLSGFVKAVEANDVATAAEEFNNFLKLNLYLPAKFLSKSLYIIVQNEAWSEGVSVLQSGDHSQISW
jgi:hypothetical protein